MVAAGVLCLLALTAADVHARGCEGLPIREVLIDGCGKGTCGHPKIQANLVSLTDLKGQGSVFTRERLELAVRRLKLSGYFLEIAPECRAWDGQARVTFNVIPNSYISKVEISGNNYFYTTDLAKRVFLRRGSVFNPPVAADKDKLKRQVEVLLSYMRKKGFDKATVKPVITPEPPDRVHVELIVDEGEVARISTVRFQIDQPPPAEEDRYSCPLLTQLKLGRVADIAAGEPYTRTLARNTRKKLRFYLQQYGFINPTVKLRYLPGERELEISIRSKECYSVVFMERYSAREETGPNEYRQVNDKALYKVLPFRESGTFDLTEAELGIEEVLVHYQTRGYLFARVDMQYIDFRQMYPGWKYPRIGSVRYMVTLGEPAEIRKITFHGAKAFKNSKLLDVLTTVPYDFFGEGGFLQVEQLMADLGKVRDFYRDHGYYRLRFPNAPGDQDLRVAVRRENETTIYRYTYKDRSFEVVKNDWENPIYIRILIDEGEPSQVSALELGGLESLTIDDAVEGWLLEEGGSFSASRVRQAVTRLKRLYQKRGFQRTVITVSCTGEEPEVSEDKCEFEKLTSKRVGIRIRVVENQQARMGEIFWHGLIRTQPDIITRDFPAVGEPFDREKLDKAVRKVRNLGVFSSVRTTYIGLEEEPPRDRIGVVIWVEEATNKYLEFSAGFQTISRLEDEKLMNPMLSDILSSSIHFTGTLLTGGSALQRINFPDLLILTEMSYTDRNFMGQAKEMTIPISYGFSTTDLARYASFMPTYRDRRFLSTLITLRVTPLIEFDRALRNLDIFEYGVETEFSHRLFEHIYVSLLNRFSRISWKEIDESEFSPLDFQIRATPQIRFDWRNSPTNPTEGTYLGTRVSYINALNDEGSRDNFVKLDLSTQVYLTFRNTITLATYVRFGTSVSVLGENLPANHRFRLGGTSGMRGYPAGGITQYDVDGKPMVKTYTESTDEGEQTAYEVVRDGDSVMNGSVELRFPMMRKKGLWGALFLDWGALMDSPRDLHQNAFRFSIGTGVRWLIGDQIPMRLDYGIVIDKRCAEVEADTGQCMENDAAGALDFGLLYTF